MPERRFRIEIVTDGKGLTEPFLREKFPYLNSRVTPDARFFVVYGGFLHEDLTRDQRAILDGFVEEGDIVAYTCKEVAP